jgi:RNA polymerase sigma-70 factor (ECF subfamily)
MLVACISRVVHRFSHAIGSEDTKEIYSVFRLNLLANDKRKLRMFEPGLGTRLGTWLTMLAVHTAYDHLRALRRRPAGLPLDEMIDIPAESPLPEEICIEHQRAEIVGKLLANLTIKDRQFMQLHFGQGLAPEQVAELMGISVKTVYTKKHKLRGRLQAMLIGYREAA